MADKQYEDGLATRKKGACRVNVERTIHKFQTDSYRDLRVSSTLDE